MRQNPGGRKLKKRLEELLLQEPWEENNTELSQYPAKQSINALISFFCSLNPLLKWRAVSATGSVVSALSKISIEDARIIMRRLMWMLNEESGGIGWGVPEAMGEIMAQSRILAGEYNRIILSYLDESGNFIEHEPLQTGVLWALDRLAETWPDLLSQAPDLTRPYLNASDPEKRGLACLIAGHLHDKISRVRLEQLRHDDALISIYSHGYIREYHVGNLAEKALSHD
ncbi:MAG: HEAT repeat domain-containing protein [Proteobacteria bacterium]|nr:HEAT repeat domain-containing protein [Pseudomonadota bacterium]